MRRDRRLPAAAVVCLMADLTSLDDDAVPRNIYNIERSVRIFTGTGSR